MSKTPEFISAYYRVLFKTRSRAHRTACLLAYLLTASIQFSRNACDLQLSDRLGDLNIARARHCAVENRMTARQSIRFADNFHAFCRRFIATIEDKTMRRHQSGGTEIIIAAPVGGTGGGTSRAQNALGGVVEAG